MKRVYVLAAMSVLTVSACSRELRPGDTVHVTDPAPAGLVAADVTAQNRINAFMYVAIVPKLKSCWGRVQGQGAIVFTHTYKRSGTNWVFNKHEVESSTIQKDQEPVALQCMNDAEREGAFPMEAEEAARRTEEMNIHWEWPVPFPSDVTTLARIINDGGGGGKECSKTCVTCDCPSVPLLGVVCSCASSCSGYTSPCVLDGNRKGCTMKLPRCATGRMGGFGGGVIAFAR